MVWLIAGIALLVLVYVLQRVRVWYTPVYVVIGVITWYAILESGVHATIAGVALGFLTPAVPLQREVKPEEVVGTVVDPEDLTAANARRASLYVRESVSVAERMETLIHPFSSFIILPIFALANAGIELSGSACPTPPHLESRSASSSGSSSGRQSAYPLHLDRGAIGHQLAPARRELEPNRGRCDALGHRLHRCALHHRFGLRG